MPALHVLAQTSGSLLSLDGLMPEGGEAQLWVVRELQTGWTLRSGWLSNQDEATLVTFLRRLAELQLPIRAIAAVFPTVPHAWRQIYYLQNAAAPVAEADEQMKIALRQSLRASVGDLIRPKTPENPTELTITGLVPSPPPANGGPSSGCYFVRPRVSVHSCKNWRRSTWAFRSRCSWTMPVIKSAPP